MTIIDRINLVDRSAPFRRSTRLLAFPLLGILLLPAGGCSKAEIEKGLKDAQTKLESVADTTVQAVEDKLPETGSVKLRSTPAAEASKADLELITIGDGRPNVVQIVTYDGSSTVVDFPAIAFHGTTTATSVSALAGKTVECDMYFRTSPGQPVAMTKPKESIAVTFGPLNVEDNAITATLGSAELIGSNDKPFKVNGGDIVAVVRGEGN